MNAANVVAVVASLCGPVGRARRARVSGGVCLHVVVFCVFWGVLLPWRVAGLVVVGVFPFPVFVPHPAPCCSPSPLLWPFYLPFPGASVPVSVCWLLLWRAAGVVAWGVVVLVLAACRSPRPPSWVSSSHLVRGPVIGVRDSVWWMRLVWCRVREGRLAWHGGRVSLGMPIFGARALVQWCPVGAPPSPRCGAPSAVVGCAWWGGMR